LYTIRKHESASALAIAILKVSFIVRAIDHQLNANAPFLSILAFAQTRKTTQCNKTQSIKENKNRSKSHNHRSLHTQMKKKKIPFISH
jgi:hypothetical protein